LATRSRPRHGRPDRAFIHIRDTVRCVQIALENPPKRGDKVKVFNQVTETYRVRDLAELIAKLTGATIATARGPSHRSIWRSVRPGHERGRSRTWLKT